MLHGWDRLKGCWRCAPAALLVVTSLVVGQGAGADAADDERRQLESNRRLRREMLEEAGELEQSLSQLEGLILALDVQLVDVSVDLIQAHTELRQARRHAAQSRLNLARVVAEEQLQSLEFGDGVLSTYVRPVEQLGGSLLVAGESADAARRAVLMRAVTGDRHAELETLRRQRAQRRAAQEAADALAAFAEDQARRVEELRSDIVSLQVEQALAREVLQERLEEHRREIDALADEEQQLLDMIRRIEIEMARAAQQPPSSLVWPASGWVSSEFGPRWGRNHNGIDIAAPTGTPVVASARGTVTHAGPMGSFGLLVVVSHGGKVTTLYAHLSSIDVARGQEVAVGRRVGAVGSTGRSTGPHLHFELRRDGVAEDPRTLLRR